MADEVNPLETLAARLLEATKAKRVSWDATSNTSYECSLGTATVVVRSKDNDGIQPFEIRLLNFGGVVVDSAVTSLVENESSWDRELVHANRLSALIEDLFVAARRNALDVDAVVAEALGAIPLAIDDGDLPF
ncbi:hypothetical protein RN607_08205 [Demequina capsici]|uniref:Uncharacterized protein n=1 Tax=Demequina capsici TaxID=3075620 RepID=A0AA96F8M9_9MICO|nr:hypothetical protein [Demequina sp. PMTSA13]WNM26181.1 hypothetical protein RN607_08205 [Demequina sp. PMTSA13]